jgi:hypothetical protein
MRMRTKSATVDTTGFDGKFGAMLYEAMARSGFKIP